MATSGAAELRGDGLGVLEVQVGDDHAGAFRGEAGGDGLADARRRAGHQRDAGGVRLGLGQACQLGFLEGPVLDPELLGFLDRGVRGDRLGAAHHVDRVDVELAGNPGGLLVRTEGEHARRPGPARWPGPRRAAPGTPAVGVAVVVGLVVLAVGGVEFLQPGDGVLDRGVGRQVQDQRLDLGAQEMVRAGRAQGAQPRVFGGFQEVEDDGVITEVPQLRFVRGRQAADHRCERGGLGACVRPPAARRSRAASGRTARPCRSRGCTSRPGR